jgi:wobble nucleotide-excising tRNase
VIAISRIVRLRHPGVLHDFSWPADLPTFGRYNLIYGWNGSGKTTISKIFRALEMRAAPDSGEVTLSINGADVTVHDFDQVTLPVRVFNRNFMAESVFPVGGGQIPPIFVLGKESVEKQKQVEQLKKNLADAQARLEFGRSKKREAEKALNKHSIDRATVIRDTLRSPGTNPYNNYDKASFRRYAQEMVDAGDTAAHRLSESDREKLLAQHRATPKPKVQEISYQPPILETQTEAVLRLVKTTVVSAVIQSLKDDSTLSSWVHQGLGLHHDRHAEMCLFCEQTLPKDRLAALEAHFSAEYDHFLQSVDAQIATLEVASRAASTLSLPSRAEFYEDLADDYASVKATLKTALDSTKSALDSLADALKNKKGRAFEALDLTVAVSNVDFQTLDRLNEIIRQHNQACDAFQARASASRQRLETDSVAGALDDFRSMVAGLQTSDTSVNEADVEVKRLNEEIARLEREIVESRQPAEELNDDLYKYLGHDELRLDVRETGYTIARNGLPATSLSEGETTAIALLYFLKSLRDRRFDLAKGVVVLDDPVSSLDANALYLAFGFIRERTEDAAQLFILTHNFTFFRQVRNWFHHLKGQNKKDVGQRPARFYMLDCVRDEHQRCSSIRPLDALLEQYDSEYHYLFARVYRGAAASTPTALEENYILPNIARRLLEAFLAFRQPHVSGELWQKLKDVRFDDAKKLRIIRFLHTHSHNDAVGEPEHDPSQLGEANSVLKDLLDFIKDQDQGHFVAMVKLVDPPAEEEDDG